MNQLTFFEKMSVLFKLLFSSPIIVGIFAFSLILMIILFFYSRLNKKIVKYVFIGIYIALIGFSIIKYGSYFLTSFDSFITLFMANIYFPIIPVYIIIMLISFIIMIVTLSSSKKSRVIKIINTVFFTLIQMLFAIFIYVVESSKIDLTSNTNLYSNNQTLTLLELGMGLFVIWIFILLVFFYLKKADKIFKTKKVEEKDDFDEYINDYNVPSNLGTNSNVVISKDNVVNGLVPEVSNVSNDFISNNSLDKSDMLVSNDSLTVADIPSLEIESLDFNEPVSVNQVADTVQSIGDFKNGFGGVENKEPDIPVSSDKTSKSSDNASDIFNSFEFLNVPVERKTDDVEVLDFD